MTVTTLLGWNGTKISPGASIGSRESAGVSGRPGDVLPFTWIWTWTDCRPWLPATQNPNLVKTP